MNARQDSAEPSPAAAGGRPRPADGPAGWRGESNHGITPDPLAEVAPASSISGDTAPGDGSTAAETAAAGSVTRVRWLAAASSQAWLEGALAQADLVLLDHAHCERKAAGAALQLMFRYPGDGALAAVLSPIAREELEHFERVTGLLRQRGVSLRPLAAPAYGATLAAALRRHEPERMLDNFLVAGLIEARSHERLALLAAHSPEAQLRELYNDLLASEARHFGAYWLLCEARWPRPLVRKRLQELAVIEHRALSGAPARPDLVRMHSAGVQELPHRLSREAHQTGDVPLVGNAD